MKRFLSAAAVIAAGLLWGCTGYFVRTLGEMGLGSMEIVTLRALVAGIILPLCVLAVKPSLFKIKLKHLWCFASSGIVSFLMFSCCYFYTMEQTSLSVAAVLLYSAPAMVTVMSAIFFKEKLTAVKIISCVLAFAGCFLVTGVLSGQSEISAIGLVTGILSAFGYALYSIFGRAALLRGYHPLTMNIYTFWFALAGLVLITDVKLICAVAFSSPGTAVFSIIMGVVTTVLPYVLYTLGLRNVENGTASVMASIEPVAASIVGWIAFAETPDIYGVCGMALVLLAVIITNIRKKCGKE